jgi:hypothetical protein
MYRSLPRLELARARIRRDAEICSSTWGEFEDPAERTRRSNGYQHPEGAGIVVVILLPFLRELHRFKRSKSFDYRRPR